MLSIRSTAAAAVLTHVQTMLKIIILVKENAIILAQATSYVCFSLIIHFICSCIFEWKMQNSLLFGSDHTIYKISHVDINANTDSSQLNCLGSIDINPFGDVHVKTGSDRRTYSISFGPFISSHHIYINLYTYILHIHS